MELFNPTRSKLYQWLDNGRIPSLQIDNKRLFDINELDEFIDNLKRDRKVMDVHKT